MQPGSENSRDSDPVAVIAVHGVADQKVDETASCVADLLIGLDSATNGKGAAKYGSFENEELHVALKGLTVPPSVREKDAWGKEIYEQLEQYTPEASTYKTPRLEGVRSESGKPNREVHVYEMHWGDLSRVKNSVLSLLIGIYRLLFQLVWIGVDTVRNWSNPPAKRIWPAFAAVHRVFAWSLTRMIPVFNLALLAMALTLAAGVFIPVNMGKDLALIAGILSGLFAMIVTGVIFGSFIYWKPGFLKINITWQSLFGITILSGIAVGFGIGYLVSDKWLLNYPDRDLAAQHFTSVASWLLVSLLFWFMIFKLRHRHPMILVEGACAWIIVTVFFSNGLQIHLPGWPVIASAATFTLTYLAEVLKFLWLFVFFFAAVALIANLIFAFCWRYNSREIKNEARSRFGTALIATTLPPLVVLSLNLALWVLIMLPIDEKLLDGRITATAETVEAQTEYHGIFEQSLGSFAGELQKHNSLSYFAGKGLAESVPEYFSKVMGVFFFVGIYAVWVFFPSVSAEFNIWKFFQKLTKEHDSVFSRKLGKNLSNAYTTPIWICLVLVAGTTIAMFFCMLINVLSDEPYVATSTRFLKVVVLAVAVVLVQNFIPSRLRSAIRAATDVGLDVTSYLSRTPKKSTVRARVLSRFASLMETICEWRKPGDQNSRGYSRIVILSHSQGTVISCDLLRLLKDDHLVAANSFDFVKKFDTGEIDLRLFTMGSPLRQLYGWRFPETFGWAAPNPASREYNWIDRDGWTYPEMWRWQSGACRKCESSHGPDPDELRGISYWWNVYRSADYVGRYLWHPENEEPDRFEPVEELEKEEKSIYPKISKRSEEHPKIREYCIGPGGHTHYWDSQTPEVSIDLDRLIALDQPDPRPLS